MFFPVPVSAGCEEVDHSALIRPLWLQLLFVGDEMFQASDLKYDLVPDT